jgi:hypothetical protein
LAASSSKRSLLRNGSLARPDKRASSIPVSLSLSLALVIIIILCRVLTSFMSRCGVPFIKRSIMQHRPFHSPFPSSLSSRHRTHT